MTILDTSLSSVSPTVMESMLKQRRQKRPAVLQRTPARFSTRIEYILFIDKNLQLRILLSYAVHT